MRDGFNERTKENIARRVSYLCSNPTCRKLTGGPHTNPEKSINIGVAAHIAAASPGGKRFDPNQTPKQRMSAENGIWLCQSCAKLIDNDEKKYTVQLLREWKFNAEIYALRTVAEKSPNLSVNKDPLSEFSTLLDDPDNWVKVLGDNYIRHRFTAQFVIKTVEIIENNFDEPWSRRFPDQHAFKHYIEYWQDSTLLQRELFIVADGGRYDIPLPKIRSRHVDLDSVENYEYCIDVNSLGWKVAMLFNQCESLDIFLQTAGIHLV
jgi:hypothetical protein